MEITIKIPDQVYREDQTYAEYFKAVQAMVDRMAVSHYKYGRIYDNAKLASVDERRCALQRISMYDQRYIEQDAIWESANRKELDTGNVDNLYDAANFLILEALFPKHDAAHFRSQTSSESPGLEFRQ